MKKACDIASLFAFAGVMAARSDGQGLVQRFHQVKAEVCPIQHRQPGRLFCKYPISDNRIILHPAGGELLYLRKSASDRSSTMVCSAP